MKAKSYTASAVRKRKWRQDNPERYLRGNRENTWRAIGLDVERATALRDSIQRCEICDEEADLHVDHNHTTNKIRGMLCPRCNHGLGNFKDSKDLLNKAINYLDERDQLVYN